MDNPREFELFNGSFISQFSIGSKAARDKVNQIAHVPKAHVEAWETRKHGD